MTISSCRHNSLKKTLNLAKGGADTVHNARAPKRVPSPTPYITIRTTERARRNSHTVFSG